MDKKIIFIPGWMHNVSHYQKYQGLDIWTEDFDPQKRIEADFLIGHSTGANFCLVNWKFNRNTKLILVGVLVPRRNILGWIGQWLKFIIFERQQSIKGVINLKYIFSTLKKVNELSKSDPLEIIREIPKEQVVFIRGKNDKFFFDKKVAELLKAEGFRLIEVKNASHHWNNEIDGIIAKLTAESG
jgi:hypothetical protein